MVGAPRANPHQDIFALSGSHPLFRHKMGLHRRRFAAPDPVQMTNKLICIRNELEIDSVETMSEHFS